MNYEDDCNLRVLHEDEVYHIFPEDNEEEPQVGDIVSALWLPNGQYYDAKVLQKGGKQGFSLFNNNFFDKFTKAINPGGGSSYILVLIKL